MLIESLGDMAHHDAVTVVSEGTRMQLKKEIKRRRLSEQEFAAKAGISYTWLRKILSGEPAGPDARAKIREALSYCSVCPCRLDVPDDETLFSKVKRGRSKK